MVHERAQRLCLVRAFRQFRQLPFGMSEEVIDRLSQRGLRGLERCRLPVHLQTVIVVSQPRLVQPPHRRDPLDPFLAPVRQPGVAGRAVDKISPQVGPAPCDLDFSRGVFEALDLRVIGLI